MKGHLIHLMEYGNWANEATLGTLEGMRTLEGTPKAPERAVLLFSHILAAELEWLRRVEPKYGQGHGLWTPLSLAECREALSRSVRDWTEYLAGVDEAEIRTPRHYTTTKGVACENTLKEIVTHVTNHGMYHRGQIAMLLRDAGSAAAATDYIQYARLTTKSR